MKLSQFIPEIKIQPNDGIIRNNEELYKFIMRNYDEFIKYVVDNYGIKFMMIEEPEIKVKTPFLDPRDPNFEDNRDQVYTYIQDQEQDIIKQLSNNHNNLRLIEDEGGHLVELSYESYDNEEGFVLLSINKQYKSSKSFIFKKIFIYYEYSL